MSNSKKSNLKQGVNVEDAIEIAVKAIPNSNAEFIVYSAVIGDYDSPPIIEIPQSTNICFVFISDHMMDIAQPWELVLVSKEKMSALIQAKVYKLFPHILFPNAKKSIWIDGSIDIIGNLVELFDNTLNVEDMATFAHPSRSCAYDEAKACKRLGKGAKDIIAEQMNTYKALGFNRNSGLLHGAVLLRRHNENVVMKALHDWWLELNNHSMRDQLSFNYVATKNNLLVHTLSGGMNKNKYFRINEHKNSVAPGRGVRLYFFWRVYYRLGMLLGW